MPRKQHKLEQIKQAAVSLAAMLVFALPVLFSAQWIMHIVRDNHDTRKVFSTAEIESFDTDDCGSEPAGTLQPFSEPVISVTFDDGWESTYSQGLKAIEKCDIKATHYILGDHFKELSYLSEAQVRSLQAAGHEIAGHTMTHPDLTSITDDQVENEVGESSKLLNKKFGGSVRDFATPLGASNDAVLQHIKAHYRSSRNTLGDPAVLEDEDVNVAGTFDRYNINAFTVRRSTTIDDLKKFIDYATQRKAWIVITYHQIDGNSPSEYAVSPHELEEHMKLIRETRIRTATIGQMLDAVQAKGL